MYPTQIVMGVKELRKDKFNAIINTDLKPFGGLWSSTYIPGEKRYVSDWVRMAEGISKDWLSNDFVIFDVKDDAKIYEVNSVDKYFELVEKYHMALEKGISKESIKLPDFEAMSRDLDIIWFTAPLIHQVKNPFFLASRHEDKPFKEIMQELCIMTTLMSLDAESSLIMNFDVIKSQKYLYVNLV